MDVVVEGGQLPDESGPFTVDAAALGAPVEVAGQLGGRRDVGVEFGVARRGPGGTVEADEVGAWAVQAVEAVPGRPVRARHTRRATKG